MFSGIVTEVGTVKGIERFDHGMRLIVRSSQIDKTIKIGESVSINGCCLTVVKIENEDLTFELVEETICKTNLKFLQKGSQINLEGSVVAGQPMGGHFVQGHVSEVAEIRSIENIGKGQLVKFVYPNDLEPYIVKKGYVALDGMSITVIDVDVKYFSVMFIPHTLVNTIAHTYKIGTKVNLEVDILGRYIEKFMRRE